jgi:hypothetical protein
MEAMSLAVLPSIKYGPAVYASTSGVGSRIEFASGLQTISSRGLAHFIYFNSFDRSVTGSWPSSNGIDLSQRHELFVHLLQSLLQRYVSYIDIYMTWLGLRTGATKAVAVLPAPLGVRGRLRHGTHTLLGGIVSASIRILV